jgi:hypothetical protein
MVIQGDRATLLIPASHSPKRGRQRVKWQHASAVTGLLKSCGNIKTWQHQLNLLWNIPDPDSPIDIDLKTTSFFDQVVVGPRTKGCPVHGQTRLVSRVFFFHPFHLNNAHGRKHLRSNVLLTGRDPTCSQGKQGE